MTKRTTIALFYSLVALICAAILAVVNFVVLPQVRAKTPHFAEFANQGRTEAGSWFAIENDLVGLNQAGQSVRLSDLKGKVWIVAQFFAVCPHCAVRNGAELRAIYEAFSDNPNFHIVCITVDPTTDTVEKLQSYAKALSADSRNWWFINAGDEQTTHRYLEDELKFFAIRERTDPLDIEQNGRFAHDLGLLLVNHKMEVVGKYPLAESRLDEARERDPGLYERLKQSLLEKIAEELASIPAP